MESIFPMKPFFALLLLLGIPRFVYAQTGKDFISSGNDKFANYYLRDAIKDFDKALAIDSTSVGAYLAKGNAYVQLVSYDSAIACYNKARKFSRQDVMAYWLKAVALYYKSDYSAAINELNLLIEKHPHFPMYHGLMGAARYRVRQYSGAIVDFSKETYDIIALKEQELISRWAKTVLQNLILIR